MTPLALILLVPATAACGYYLILTSLGWLSTTTPPHKYSRDVTVVVPAHDEEQTLSAAVASVWRSEYPADRLRVLVVADNCRDGTAAVARRLGADVVVRTDPARTGKGYALAVGIPAALTGGADAVLVLDADCELDPTALRHLTSALATAGAVQAAVVPRNPLALPAGLVAAVGSELENGVAAGRSALGLAVGLRGTGMMFNRSLLERQPWNGFGLAEDAEHTARLREVGVRVRFVPAAVVRTEVPPTGAALCVQRTRWRAALSHGGTGLIDRLLGSKPLVLAQLGVTVVVCVAFARWLPTWTAVWAGGVLLATGFTYLRATTRCDGKVSAHGLLQAGWLVAKLVGVALSALVAKPPSWERTPRAAEVGS